MKLLMNKLLISTIVSAAISSFTVNASGEPGKINFEGSVTNTPCGISADSLNQTVDFGQVSRANLMHGGNSERQEFEIKLVNCQIENENKVAVTFRGDVSEENHGELLAHGDAGDVVIKMFTEGEQQIQLGEELDPTEIGPSNSYMNTLHFYAVAAKRTGIYGVLDGNFSGEATFTLRYE
ncbi:hypothetical protein BS333_19205 [Vibrio azureus]|uniref:Fimbrial-type adhesion domain-containing protein n=2 Tax=Vibrio azureus TaxID=512649 RepID=U3AAT2_9VIBR|nr:hypothetical protein BS333_19205 [Vibrio azureus]GAD77051.1 hypothetical protein VAZ01S_060_00010 [Vibrio azureus NBRC 104587]